MDKMIGKIGQIVQKIDALTKQRVIAALIMLYNGIMLLVSPHMAPRGMTQAICVGIALASLGFLVEAYSKKQNKAVVISILALAAAVYFFICPDGLAYYLRYLLGLVVLSIGLLHLVQAFQTDRVLKLPDRVAQPFQNVSEKTGMTGALHKAVKDQVDLNLNPTLKMVKWLTRGKYASLISGILLALFGIAILIFPIEGNMTITVIYGTSMVILSLMTLIPAIVVWVNQRIRGAETP